MDNLENRLEILCEVFDRWLSDDNEYLRRAAQQTVDEGYFNFPDVQFSLKSLTQSLSEEALQKWISQSDLSDENDARGKNALCLHAGNIPLVGFQNALAVLLSGARYTGKISRKDPYLLPTFLNEVKKTAVWSDAQVQWSHRLDDFEGMQHDLILFAGSEQSAPAVKQAIKDLNLQKDKTKYLIRTAHFSMAYVEEKGDETFQNLTEAILRYGGQGCRSVAVVVSPFALTSVKNTLKKQAENFWAENPQHRTPKPKLRQRFAYNKAVERHQLWLQKFLVQEEGLELDQDFICYWMEGDKNKFKELANQCSEQLQSIYITRSSVNLPKPNESVEFELLSDAQQPPIYWKPDGTDTLKWLTKTT